MKRKSLSFVAIVLGACVTSAGIALAAGMAPADAIKARQSNFKDIGGAFKAIRDQLRLSTPNLAAIKESAQQIKNLAADQSHWFPKGTGAEAGVKTAAKAEIWSDAAGFSEALNKFGAEAPKLLSFAEANDIDGLKKQVGVVGRACKGCHDTYRLPDED